MPDFLDPHTGICVSALQTWVLRSEGRTILVDTGAGNHKERPYAPAWNHLRTDFLGNLARAGVRPEDVDLVINTHLHVDHVGWNTYLDDGSWVPTFPNATYLLPRADFDFWNPANGHAPRLGRGNQNVFEDSVAPVHEAGLALLWEDSHRIDAGLTLELAPGHTPGSSVLALASGDDRALFVGDLLHTPLQFVEPDTNSCFCEDPAVAGATRRKLLGRAADTRALVLPAHRGDLDQSLRLARESLGLFARLQSVRGVDCLDLYTKSLRRWGRESAVASYLDDVRLLRHSLTAA